MIKINLLPFRAAKKRENIRRQVSIFLLSLIFFIALIGYAFFNLNNKISALKAEQTQLKGELAKYSKTTKRIKEIQKRIKEANEKLKVIKGLEKKKTGPVRLLGEISSAVPKDKLWLVSIDEKKGILIIEGSAIDNKTVALFMTKLEKAQTIKSVDLKSTKLKNLKQFEMDVTDFVLSCKTYSYEEPEEKAAKDSKKKKKGKSRKG
jgi:type IV pilus assembly protein PilN